MKTVKKSINDRDVSITLLGLKDGVNISLKIARVAAPAYGQLIEAFSKIKDGKKDIPIKDIVLNCLDAMDEMDVNSVLEKLFDGMLVDDRPMTLDQAFAGNYGFMLDCVIFAVEKNFSSFFEASIFKNLFSESEMEQ
ncbi:putative tape measure chaperone [Erwinia phage Panisse]|uniref:Tail assembly chaperone n=2 Tax=Kolesnikvirus TaxID=1985293 RepID=A0AAU8EHS9_9CAUD|nr:putative tape measure chaperone [Erwinia phage SunLIRen]WJN64391.1 putative tape measure chaperone [Erwinia phage Panisse]WJN64684.1 putative tape measure chaperone [Erwinia phage Pistou]